MVKILIQCDFDGTITPEDVSFLILDAFGSRDWRQILREYKEGKISVARFSALAFAAVKADEKTLLGFVREKARIRPGFRELLNYCRRRGLNLVVVSNGLDFYVRFILRNLGAGDIEVFAAQTRFGAGGIEARYLGPQGELMEDGFKEAYLQSFQEEGYRVVYVGNGFSDISPAKKAYYVFATGDLLTTCRELKINHTPFDDLSDVMRGLELLTGQCH